MRRFLIALLALVLLLGMIPAATMEGLENEILSETVDLAVPEEEVELGGEPEDAGAEERAVKANDYFEYDGEADIVIPADITSIKNRRFYNCWELETVRFEAGSQLEEIGGGAFYSCGHLKRVELPDTVKEVGSEAFMFCYELERVDLPSATSIGHDAFYWSGVKDVTLSDMLPEILYRTFEGSGLVRMDIPKSVTRIGDDAFKECKALKSLTLPEGLQEIGNSAFLSCESLKALTLPDSVVKIGDQAFNGCAAMETLTISKGMTEIPGQAFAGCGMKTLVVPDNIVEIGNYAFAGCDNLIDATLPDGVTYGTHLFSGCSSLQSVTLPKGITEIPESMFYGCGFKTLPLPDTVTKLGEDAFGACGQLESIEIPEQITSIGNGAFRECPALKHVTLSKSCDTVSTLMFSKCPVLETVEIPEGVTRIGQQAFEYCTSLKTVVLPESVTTIGSLAFRGCTGLETLVIPSEDISFNFYGSQDVTPFSGCSDKLTFVCRRGSAADKYAEAHGIARKYVEPTQITLSETGTVTMKRWHTLKLSASLTPSYATTELTWTSSDPDVARALSSDTLHARMIDAVAPGTAVITVQTSNGLSASVTYQVEGDATTAPTATATAAPTASAKPDATAAPTAKPVSLAKAKVTLKAASYAYTGKAIKPAVTVKLNGKALKKGTDYKVAYKNNKTVGKATVTVKGIGAYTGSVKKAFRIVPKKVAGLKLTEGKGKLVAKWTKSSGVDGYELQYGLKKTFSGAKTQAANKAATVKATIKNLKAGKTYYVRIRSTKTVKGVKYVSAWSAVATGKVK